MNRKRWISAIHTASQVFGDGICGFLGSAASVRTAALAIVSIATWIQQRKEKFNDSASSDVMIH